MTDTQTEQKFDAVSFIMEYEGGTLDEDEVVAGFQELINSGLAWQLQGAYGRQAQQFIDEGFCSRPAPQKASPPEIGEVRSSGSGQGNLPFPGPYKFVSRDTMRLVGNHKYRIVLYGAYSAFGMVGSESNGILVLDEDAHAVIADKISCATSGYYGPTAEQLASFEMLRSCSDAQFKVKVNSSPQCRMPI